jgi:hypothetical protein
VFLHRLFTNEDSERSPFLDHDVSAVDGLGRDDDATAARGQNDPEVMREKAREIKALVQAANPPRSD